MIHKKIKNIIFIIFCFLIIYICFDLIKKLDLSKITGNFVLSYETYFLIAFLCLLHELINIIQNITLYKCLQNNFSKTQFIFIYYSSYFSKYMMFFKLGTPIRFALLKTLLGIRIRNSISIKMVLVFFSLCSTIITGLVGLYFSEVIGEQYSGQSLAILSASLFLIILLFLFVNQFLPKAYKGNIWILTKIFDLIFDLTKRLKKFPMKVIGFISIGMVIRSIILSSISFLIITQISNISISFFTILAISAIGNLASLLSILPMGIGPKDLSLIYLFSLIGVEKEHVLIMLLYDRIIWIFIPLAFGAISFLYLKFKKLIIFKKS